MKRTKVRQLLYVTAMFSFTCFLILTFYLAIRHLPGTITYSIAGSETVPGKSSQALTSSALSPLHSSLYAISGEGPFTICSLDEGIFVYSGDALLYKVKASIASFPEADRRAIEKGIAAENKSRLFEIIEYMES